jgi:hypothetical protein
MDDALGNTFVIEVKDLLTEMKVVDECRAASTDAQGVLVVRDRTSLGGGQNVVRRLRRTGEVRRLRRDGASGRE